MADAAAEPDSTEHGPAQHDSTEHDPIARDATGGDSAGRDSIEHGRHVAELRREAYTMALYVAICLLAALTALPEKDVVHPNAIVIIWGVTIGLALAHWFAFRLSSRLVGAGRFAGADVQLAAAQLLGAAVVAVLATLAILFFPPSIELEAAGLFLAVFIAAVGYLAVRRGGSKRTPAIAYAVAVLIVAVVVVEIKNRLVGH